MNENNTTRIHLMKVLLQNFRFKIANSYRNNGITLLGHIYWDTQ